jgi:hypothetical protein
MKVSTCRQHSYGLEDMKSIHVYHFSYKVALDAMGLIWKIEAIASMI